MGWDPELPWERTTLSTLLLAIPPPSLPMGACVFSLISMSFIFEWLSASWANARTGASETERKNWEAFLEQQENERRRDRIIAWKDRVGPDNFAVNSEESEYYRRSAGFVWRIKDPTGTHRARNHQYLYNLEVYGHTIYTRRDKGELEAAQNKVLARAASGDLGPLSPI